MKAKRFLLVMFALLTCIQTWSADGDKFSTTVNGVDCNFQIISETDKTCRIGYLYGSEVAIPTSTSGDFTIPASVNDYRVVEIGDYAFSDCSGLTSVTIPNSVTTIRRYAFRKCSGLMSMNIPNSVTNIEESAFSQCSSITSVTIPNSVTTIEDGAFSSCSGLTRVNISDLAIWCDISFNSIDSNPLYHAHHLFLNGTEIKDLVIPNSLTTIKYDPFVGCSGLTSVTIPNSVTEIETYAFRDCTGLTSITIPNSVTNIRQYAFKGCSGLTSVTIPNSVTSIERGTFEGCSGLTSVTIPNSVTSIGYRAFYDCTGLSEIHSLIETPFAIDESTFMMYDGSPKTTLYETIKLYVPKGTVEAYKITDGWKKFVTIEEMGNDITIGSAGMGTFCSTHALDFSGTEDIKAYIVSAFKPSTGEVTLTRITDVPANTGIVVKGNANTYAIPWGPGETVVANMLVGVTTNTVLNKVDGDYTNYILAKKNGNLGFYAVSDGSTLSAGKAYLPLPTAQLPSGAGARQMTMIFDDETTGIEDNNREIINNNCYYDLQGRRVSTPTRGLYIVNGKKVIIK